MEMEIEIHIANNPHILDEADPRGFWNHVEKLYRRGQSDPRWGFLACGLENEFGATFLRNSARLAIKAADEAARDWENSQSQVSGPEWAAERRYHGAKY